MNAHALTAAGIALAVTGAQRSAYGRVIDASFKAGRSPIYVVSVNRQWFRVDEAKKNYILDTGDTDGLDPLTDEECDALCDGSA